MKLSKLTLALMISASCLFAPMKKAEAGFIIGISTGAAVGVLIMVGGSGLVFTHRLFENISDKINVGGIAFLAGTAIIILDSKTDNLSSDLSREFPTIPDYIINEVVLTVKEKAALIPFNPEGIKSVTLTAAEVSEIESAMPLDVSIEELNAFRELLSTEISL